MALVALSTFPLTSYAALSDEDFAKCMELAVSETNRLVDRADKADAAFRKKLDKKLDRFAARQPDYDAARSRMAKITDRLIESLELADYRHKWIEKEAELLLATENKDDFSCWPRRAVRRWLDRFLDAYTAQLDYIGDAVAERVDLEELDQDEGLVAILFRSKGNLDTVYINRLGHIGGGISFDPPRNSDYFRVIKAKAGTYRWDRVTTYMMLGRGTAHMKRAKLDFEVEPGKLNYIGALSFDMTFHGMYGFDVYDRASVLLSLLESRYPELLEDMQMHNGLNDEDLFIDFYFREKQLAAMENPNE